MSEHKHTPGPWVVHLAHGGTLGREIRGATRLLGYAYCGASVSIDDADANALLIAAAPDLLEACERAICEAVADDLDGWYAEMRSAIAKATGAQP